MENNTSLQQQLLEAGVHFGHLKKKWNPKMLPYIFAEKKGIHIIDLNKSSGWYDFTVKITGHDIFERRYAGRVETGKPGISDPAMGRVI